MRRFVLSFALLFTLPLCAETKLADLGWMTAAMVLVAPRLTRHLIQNGRLYFA